jgi:hypothetical protein
VTGFWVNRFEIENCLNGAIAGSFGDRVRL